MANMTIQQNDARMTVIGKSWPDVPQTSGAGDWDNTYDGTYDGPIPRTDMPDRIEITTPPIKTLYEDGENIDFSGMVVTAYYPDSTEWGIVPPDEIMLPPIYQRKIIFAKNGRAISRVYIGGSTYRDYIFYYVDKINLVDSYVLGSEYQGNFIPYLTTTYEIKLHADRKFLAMQTRLGNGGGTITADQYVTRICAPYLSEDSYMVYEYSYKEKRSYVDGREEEEERDTLNLIYKNITGAFFYPRFGVYSSLGVFRYGEEDRLYERNFQYESNIGLEVNYFPASTGIDDDFKTILEGVWRSDEPMKISWIRPDGETLTATVIFSVNGENAHRNPLGEL